MGKQLAAQAWPPKCGTHIKAKCSSAHLKSSTPTAKSAAKPLNFEEKNPKGQFKQSNGMASCA